MSQSRTAKVRGGIPEHVKRAVKARDGNKCRICGVTTEFIHFDHLYPHDLGGPTTVENIQILCPTCNTSKGKDSVSKMQSLDGARQISLLAVRDSPDRLKVLANIKREARTPISKSRSRRGYWCGRGGACGFLNRRFAVSIFCESKRKFRPSGQREYSR